MAQRRLRALGMLSAIGATEGNLRLVMIVNGLAVGVAGVLAGGVLGFAAWFAYVPTLQQAAGHVVDAANLPWWAIALGVVFAVATSVLASRRPAKTMAAVPVVAALSGRPAAPKAVHRSALPASSCSRSAWRAWRSRVGWPGSGRGGRAALHLLIGLVAVIIGIVLLAPLAISTLARAGPRCRSRSGSRCATWSATGPGPAPRWRRPRSPCSWPRGSASSPASSSRTSLSWTGPNLSSSQLVVYAQPEQGGPPVRRRSAAPSSPR